MGPRDAVHAHCNPEVARGQQTGGSPVRRPEETGNGGRSPHRHGPSATKIAPWPAGRTGLAPSDHPRKKARRGGEGGKGEERSRAH
eukprot:9168575-Pyramimonas_sp.AAC.1